MSLVTDREVDMLGQGEFWDWRQAQHGKGMCPGILQVTAAST